MCQNSDTIRFDMPIVQEIGNLQEADEKLPKSILKADKNRKFCRKNNKKSQKCTKILA